MIDSREHSAHDVRVVAAHPLRIHRSATEGWPLDIDRNRLQASPTGPLVARVSASPGYSSRWNRRCCPRNHERVSMEKFRRVVWVASCGALVLSACKNEACERQRLEVANKWEQVTGIAARRSLSTDESGSSAVTWKSIKEQAELVQSSFETPQVTWSAAQNGLSKIRTEFKPLEAEEQSRLFKQTLEAAEKAQSEYESGCR